MDRPIWNDLAVFAAVVEAGSLAGAARQLGVSTSAVSHTLRGLEVRLGARLINRTTRSLSPTEAGLQLLAALRPALAEVGAAVGRVQANRDRPAGKVRVNAHRVAALQHIVPRLAALRAAYPEIVIELVVQDGLVDMVAEGFDAGIRHPPMLEQDMIAVRLDEGTETLLAASPDYLVRHGAPSHPNDLTEHACISYRYTTSRSLHPWELERRGSVSGWRWSQPSCRAIQKCCLRRRRQDWELCRPRGLRLNDTCGVANSFLCYRAGGSTSRLIISIMRGESV